MYDEKDVLKVFQKVYEDVSNVYPIIEVDKDEIVTSFRQRFAPRIQKLFRFLDFYLKNPDSFLDSTQSYYVYKNKVTLRVPNHNEECKHADVWKLTIYTPVLLNNITIYYSVILEDSIYYYKISKQTINVDIYPCRCFILQHHSINKDITFVEYSSNLLYLQPTAITLEERIEIEAQAFKFKTLLNGWNDMTLKMLNDDVLSLVFRWFIPRMSDLTLMHLWSYVNIGNGNVLLYKPLLMEEIARRIMFYMDKKHKEEYKQLILYYMTRLFKSIEDYGNPFVTFHHRKIRYKETKYENIMLFLLPYENTSFYDCNNISRLIKPIFISRRGSNKPNIHRTYYSLTNKTFYETGYNLEHHDKTPNTYPEECYDMNYSQWFILRRNKGISGLYNVKKG